MKKKIGIMTYHRSINYGAVMQAYSLSKRISDDFPEYEVEIIDYISENAELIYQKKLTNYIRLILKAKTFKEKLVFSKHTLDLLKRCIKNYDNQDKLNAIFEKQIESLPLSSEKIVTDNEKYVFEKIKDKYKVLIVGSDTVFNWQIRKFPNPYFLNAELGAIKMSYAASSYGQDYLQITDEQKAYLKEAWRDFDYLGVRDAATESFAKYVDETLVPHHNCDPTVFLDISALPVSGEDIREVFVKEGIDLSKPIIGIMATDWLAKLVREIFGDRYQIVAVFKDSPYADFILKNLSPLQWSKVFSYFSVTFTHFFHGNLLSLKNGTPTVVIENRTPYNSKHNSKIRDLMTRLDLFDFCYYRDEVDMKKQEIIEAVDDRIKNRSRYSERIVQALGREALCYNDFREELKKILSR